MTLLVQQLGAGLAAGAVYALIGLALVMIYRAIGHFNFAQGEMATFSAFVAWALMRAGMPYWLAFAATVALSFAAGVAIERILFAPIRRAPALSHLVVFIGLLCILNSLAGFLWDYDIKPFPSPFPERLPGLGGLIGPHQLGMIGVAAALFAALWAFFRFTGTGLAMRAAVMNPVSARLLGIRTGWMAALGWGIASAIGAVAGILVAPVLFLEPNMMAGALLYGFAGAILGGADSPGGAVLGGLIVGLLETLLGAFVPWIGTELKLSVALALIVGVLVVRPHGLFGRGATGRA